MSLINYNPANTDAQEEKRWQPFPGAQTNFLATPAFEALFGGAAGGGKTDCLIMDAVRQVAHPRYRAVIFRRTMTELADADGPIQRSHEWFPALGGVWREGKKMWFFPSGAQIYFHHMEHEEDCYKYQGAQYQFIGFDEVTHFTLKQYLYLFSRCRTTQGSGLQTYIRAATNPGGVGHAWVKERFIDRGISNRIGYFLKIGDVDTEVPPGTFGAKSRIFIPATVKDNPRITQEYIDNLMLLDPVERDRLLKGDWDAEYKERIYDNFTSDNISAEADYDPAYPIEWFADDGYHHPRVILLAQERPLFGIPDCLCIFYEYYQTNQDHESSIRFLLNETPYPEPDMVIYDPNALYLGLALADHNLVCSPGYNNVSEGIKGVRHYICDGQGVRSLYVHPRCVHLIRTLRQYRYSDTPDTGGDLKPVKEDDDPCDALRYGIATTRMWNHG